MDGTKNSEPLWDFEVRYRFYSPAEGGRSAGPPFQGFRCDWFYAGDDIAQTGMYMIWPEFLDEAGAPFAVNMQIPVSGTARMFILSQKLRQNLHRHRIREGVRGYFLEGNRKVAEAVVSRVLDLHTHL